ncbi:MAG: hypothetical protein CO035_00900, partial [Candidatus Omnitrophica bacterium CG_4_9_14_0_2_um_filter_42_8]
NTKKLILTSQALTGRTIADFLPAGSLDKSPDFAKKLGYANIGEYLKDSKVAAIIDYKTGKRWISFGKDNMELALIEQRFDKLYFDIISFDTYKNETYRETYRLGDQDLNLSAAPEAIVELVDAGNARIKILNIMEEHSEDFIGPSKVFKDSFSYDEWRNNFTGSTSRRITTLKDNDSRIVFYAAGTGEVAAIKDGKLYIGRALGTKELTNEYDRNKAGKYIKDQGKLRSAKYISLAEFDANNPSINQQYINLVYFDKDGKEDILLRYDLESRAYGFTETLDNVSLDAIIAPLLIPEAEQKFVGQNRPFSTEEFKVFKAQLMDRNNIQAKEVYLLNKDGTKELYNTSVYYKGREIIRIDKYGLSFVLEKGIKHTFEYNKSEIGRYLA